MPPIQFWKPGTVAPGSSLDREAEAEGSLALSSARSGNLSLDAQRKRLPIYKHRDKLLWCIEKYRVTIVVGQTGSGKSTRESPYTLTSTRRAAILDPSSRQNFHSIYMKQDGRPRAV